MARVAVQNKEVIKRLAQARLEAIKNALKPIVEEEVTRMVQRTRSGIDVNGKPFVPYSEEYNRRKALHTGVMFGRRKKPELRWKNDVAYEYRPRRKLKQRGLGRVKGAFSVIKLTPDLTLTGRMLESIVTRVTKTSTVARAVVAFSSVAEAAKARGNQAIRYFFGFSKEQEDRIRAKLKAVR